jgi:hypothetical protein
VADAAYYPPANRTAQWFGDTYPGTAFPAVEKVCLHTTESTGWPAYGGGASAPHLTCRADFDLRRLRWRQHFSCLVNSRALRNPPGGVQTNHDGVLQVEIVGTCDRERVVQWEGRYLCSWQMPEWVLRDLGEFLAWVHAEHGVPLVAPLRWPAYGSGDSARMSGHTFNGFRGVLGHLHVPENTHGDPGDIDIEALLEAAGADPAPPPPPAPRPAPMEALVRQMPVLSPGDRGEDVQTVQALLLARGRNPGAMDGVYGPRTADQVKAAQRAANLAADGVVGSRTWPVLLRVS